MNLNKLQLIGRTTQKPELSATDGGTKVAKFGLATNNTYTKDGEKVENTNFHNIVAFGKTAEVLAEYVVKGQELYIEGRQKNSSWEKDDGTRGYRSEVILQKFEFGNKPKGSEENMDDIADEMQEDEDITPEDIPF